ncbi:PH domain-containing protein [Ornithinibacillus californiensis]|uniref:PH domain-containing protein n=1 Tax=Ornithinibacillus californiensis TaxID=161536 RepID=UPI001F406803|nr:PH domain-containing protein [Ornithinibacillus californiensis]
MMSEPSRLHPATVIFNLVKGIKDSFFLFVIAFVSLINLHILYAILMIVVLVLIIAIASFVSWQRFTYHVEGDELKLEYGVFIRKKRYISKNRVQSIDLTQNLLHRIFKLVKVEIETAGTGAEAEASLNAVTLMQGKALRTELKTLGEVEQLEENHEEKHPARTITRKRLIITGATSGSIGVILAIAGAVSSELSRFIPSDFYDNAYSWVVGLGIIILVMMIIGVFILLWVLGIVGTIIKYWNFTIEKVEEDIVITCGLLEKKHITIPMKRIQAVGYVESLIRQPLGYATVIAEIAGGSNQKGEDFSTVLFPIMKKSEIDNFLTELLPNYTVNQTDFTKLPKRSAKYYLFRTVVPSLVLLIAALYFLPQLTWIPVAILGLSILLGLLQVKDSGYALEDNKLTIRYRNFNKVTMVMNHKRIQAFNKKQHILHRKEKLATIKLSIVGKMGLGKHYHVKELDLEAANKMADWYSYRGV